MSEARYKSFEEFWPFYVGEHAHKSTRTLHWVGTTAAASCLAAAALTRRPWLAAFAPIAGYGPAWFSHFFIENNRPATFTYPLWSLRADLVMWGKMVTGTMDAEVERASVMRAQHDAREPVAPTTVESGAQAASPTPTHGVSGSNGAAHL